MTEPSAPRPAPGPGRPAPGSAAPSTTLPPTPPREPAAEDRERFAGLEQRPVADHVEVFEAEHDRLQSELGTIDRV
jgi:hypothetical protein